MLFLTGLNHYWTLRVPQSSYISSLKFLQQGVKRLPFWCNASLTEDKSASIPRLSVQSNTTRKDEAATSTVTQAITFHNRNDPYIVKAVQSGVTPYLTIHLQVAVRTVGDVLKQNQK